MLDPTELLNRETNNCTVRCIDPHAALRRCRVYLLLSSASEDQSYRCPRRGAKHEAASQSAYCAWSGTQHITPEGARPGREAGREGGERGGAQGRSDRARASVSSAQHRACGPGWRGRGGRCYMTYLRNVLYHIFLLYNML
jgi:hypothetical protein